MIDVWVTGSSLTALDAALSLAEVGLNVRVSVGGSADELPLGPQPDPNGAIAAMVARVGAPLPGDSAGIHAAPQLSKLAPRPVLLRGADGALHPLSEIAVVGIPTAPLAEEVIALLGRGGAFRAYMDRLRPVLSIGKEQNLGNLVRGRLGAKVERLLVDPIVRERTVAAASEVDVAMLAPGLNEALTRVGSLTGGALSYGDRNVARETTVEPDGGWAALRSSLLDRLALYGVELVENTPVRALGRVSDGEGWVVRTGSGESLQEERVRAVIIDVGGSPHLADAYGFADEQVLSAPETRQYVEIGIKQPDWFLGVESLDPTVALMGLSGSDASVAGWMVRVTRRGAVWTARFSGPRLTAGARVTQPHVEGLCVAAGVEAKPGAIETAATRHVVAPLVSVEADHERLRAIGEFDSSHARLRPVGESWAAGDFCRALSESLPRIIELRREMLGIA